MSVAYASSFHSSSECSTTHISRHNLDADELDTISHSTTSARVRASVPSDETRMTPLDSDAFASPTTRPPTGVLASITPTPTTARGGRRLNNLRPPNISVILPSSPSNSSTSKRGSSVGAALPRQHGAQPSPHGLTPANNPGTVHHQNIGSNQSASKYRSLLSGRHVAVTPVKVTTAMAPSAGTSAGAPHAAPHSAVASAPAAAILSPWGRAASLPTVPTTRGSGSGWMQQSSKGAATATTGDTARSLPPLPPLRPPSSYFIAGSKSGSRHASRRNGSSGAASNTSQGWRQTPQSSIEAVPQSQTPVTVKVEDPDGDSGWWAAARRYVAGKGDQASMYLERLVNPGAAGAATRNTRRAAVEARSRRASQSFQALPRDPSHDNINESGRASRAASVSSGLDGAFNADRRTPSSHLPVSPVRSGANRSPYEPFSRAPPQDSGVNNDGMPLDVILIDRAHETLAWNNPSVQAPEVRVVSRDAVNDSFNNVGDVSGSDADGVEMEPDTYVVDLLSALRGYLSHPTEPFGHLVAAALASRSAEAPVRGFEIAAAEHNPFLVRMIVDSGTLEVQDEEAQRNVQDTVDELIPAEEGGLSPGIYEYLSSFFKMPFVRLSHKQYALLKRSGFEYIKLMFDHQHVLPDEPFHSILINESYAMHIFNFVFMVVQLLSIIFCTVTIAVVLTVWMKLDNNKLQSYGFYTLIVFGGGWALYLIFIIYAVHSRQEEQRYEPQAKGSDRLAMPSPYVAVVPVIPLFDIMCLLTYGMAVKKKRMILGHNIVASSRLSGAFYAVWFAFPQLITQSYFNNIELSIDAQYRHHWAYTMLIVAVIAQWGIALFGYVGFLFMHDSIDGFGFSCFNKVGVQHQLERYSAAAHTLHYLTAYLLETNVYLIAANTINRPISAPCDSYWNVVLALSAFSVFYMLLIFLVIILTDVSAVRISFTSIALLAVQVALCVCSERLQQAECGVYRHSFFRGAFVFGYLSWGAYFFEFLLWLAMMLQCCILCNHKQSLSLQAWCPCGFRDECFAKPRKAGKSSATKDSSSQAAAEE
ncbi:hypothetical protein ABL78_1372 [Leptomonas seymouri]|uniref:Transmembrane protein n=1 Tax=Leptomonas seymouri TaxID=5684 RepID=A0A0N0P838_LEPSE|nr:hypothetical protein ABL78_1372 [Leptomonas seymouri]|eukprot:KPI89496.1 hypothetical protein ABL78_1372 [Leptomonas seymouri]